MALKATAYLTILIAQFGDYFDAALSDSISKLPQSVFRSIGINTTKYRPLVFGSIDPNTTVVFCSIHPNTSVVFRSIGPILNVVLRSNNVVSDVALRSIDVVFRSIDS